MLDDATKFIKDLPYFNINRFAVAGKKEQQRQNNVFTKFIKYSQKISTIWDKSSTCKIDKSYQNT